MNVSELRRRNGLELYSYSSLCANLNSVHSPGVNCCTADTRILQRPGPMCWNMRKVFTPKWFGVLDESGLLLSTRIDSFDTEDYLF